MKLAPEYGGDGVAQGRCASIAPPAVALPAHATVLSMAFASGTQLPTAYRSGAFVANHRSRFDAGAPASELADGSLLIGDDVGGRIWRVTYRAP